MNRWFRIRLSLGLLISLIFLTGCPPEFEDGTCETDADCFPGEVCNATTNSCQLAVVEVEPEITSLTATPNPAPPNSQVTVEWTTNQALSGVLSDASGELETYSGANLASGSYTFEIGTEAREFTLTARNGDNIVEETITVEIDPPTLAINNFEATPNPVEPEGLLTMEWETENAVSARITGPSGDYMVPVTDLDAGQWQTTITQNTTFTLEITSVVGDTLSQDLQVVVEGGEPAINSFEATPEAIVSGADVELAWDTTGADSITIVDDLGGNVPLGGEAPTGGTVTVNPSADREYTLTASNLYGDTTQTVSVSVEETLSIDSFTAGQAQITEGESVMLGWTVSGTSPTLELTTGTGAVIDISGQPAASGAVAVSPTTTTTYTLTATTPLQTDTATVTVTVVPPAPVINSFTANPTAVVIGGTTTLSWDITGATSIAITNDLGTTIPTTGKAVTADSVAVNLTATRTFTIRADNAGGFDEATVTVVAGSSVAITSFSASPSAISPGQSVTLTWATANANSIDIESNQGDTIDVTGKAVDGDSVMVSPTVTTTYTLTANGLGGPVTQDVTVTVQPAVSITSFTATPSTVVAGDSLTLTWATANATSLQITYVDGSGTTQLVNTVGKMVSGDSVTVTPTEDTTYTITVDGFQGPVTDTVSVTVQQPVSITSFTVDVSPIAPGDTTNLTWAVENATSVTITDSGGTAVDLTGKTTAGDSVAVSPTSTETYTLTANGPGGPVTADVTVTVQPAVAITSFTANPSTSVVGDPVTLSWATTDATSIAITYVDGGGTTQTVDTTGTTVAGDSVTVNPTESTTYTITAQGFQGPVTATASVTVQQPVSITSFTVDVSPIAPGDTANLTWVVANATSVTITDSGGTAVDLTGKATAGDSVAVSPTSTETYTLTANGPGGPVTADVTITVQPAVAISSFTANPTTSVAGDPVTLAWVTTDASSITITYVDGGGTTQTVDTTGTSAAGDSVIVNPTESTTYTLTAQGFQGPVTATASVTVQQPVSVTSFVTDRTAIAPGEDATLTWAVANATSVSIADGGGTPVDLTGTTTAGDSVAVSPASTTTYTLTANGPGGPVTSQVSVEVVDPDGITITEILADPTGANDQHQWVEITNTGTTILDLSKFSMGAGATAYDEALVQLSGSLAPGGCAVIGGPQRTQDNGDPTYTVSSDFDPDLPAAGGVALFVGPTSEQTATRTPVSSIVWGGSNPNGLLDDDGTAKTELSPALVEGSSLTRTSGSDVFVQAAPTAGQCFHIEAVSPSVGSNQATGTISITGFGLDTALDAFSMGTDVLTSCAETAGGVDCTIDTSTQSGLADLTVSRVNEVVSDGSGGTTIQALGSPIDGTLADAYLYETEIADPGVTYYCGISAVSPASPVAVGTDVTVTLEVYLQGETDAGGYLPAGYVVEALEFGGGVLPATIFDAAWATATSGLPNGNNATFTAVFNNAAATTSEIAFRVSPDSGVSWYYCDTNASNGSNDGYQVGGGQVITWQ